LQKSLWGEVPKIAAIVQLGDLFPGGFGCWLDEDGDLYLDAEHVDRLLESLPRVLTAEVARRIQRVQGAACQTLLHRTWWAASKAPELAPDAAREAVSTLGSAIASILPYGMLMKFAPDAVLGLLREAGDVAPAPLPTPSSGRRLMQELARLAAHCQIADYPPARLASEWPDVPAGVSSAVRAFSRAHVGMGALPWDEPGYEDPLYVVGAIKVAFPEMEGADRTNHRVGSLPAAYPMSEATDLSHRAEALRDLLTFWLEFLDRETWYVRQAFFVGMVPLLRNLYERAPIPEETGAATYLFMDLSEIHSGTYSFSEAEERRRRYDADERYLQMHGVGPKRLADMMGGP
jgi:hypothetical protein